MSLPKTYRKAVATKLTPHFREALAIVEVPLPTPGPGEVLIRVRYAGVNASDVNMTAGRYEGRPELPLDLGFEAAGEVVAVGEGVTHLRVGDHAMYGLTGGGFCEYRLLPARHAIPIPAATPEALTLIVSGLTASIALDAVGAMGSGETVLVTAAAGGTGQYAVQLAKLAGNHVIGTCGSAEKAEMLRQLGCDRVINYREEEVKRVLRAEYPKGVDLIYESVGGALFDTAVGALARHGRLIIIGFISEYVDGFEKVTRPRIYTRILAKSASVRGFFLPHFGRHFKAHSEKLIGLIHSGQLQVVIDPRSFVGLDAVADAVEHLHSGQSRGKVVVQIAP